MRALVFTYIVLMVLISTSQANDTSAVKPSAWDALKSGQAIAIMRHALAPGFGDPIEFDVSDCSTQRNLSDGGQKQAKQIGNIFRTAGITQATVLSSEWCRCRETATNLDLGVPAAAPMLNSFFQNRGNAESQTQALERSIRKWLEEADTIRVLVTHQVNISALTGRGTGSGDILVVGLKNDDIIVLDQITAPATQ
ncbi:MAG: histidine phosphatase family protein [Granulosicoccus sp.]